jgi:hypothetical protein
MNFSKRIIMVFCLFVSSVTFGELSADSMFTPEMIAHMKMTNSVFDLKDGLESGKIDPKALLHVASQIKDTLSEAAEVNDATIMCGQIGFIPTASMARFRIGTGTCEFGSYIFGLGGIFEVKTKNLLIATAVAVALTVAYKKGYFGAIKNYFTKSSENDEDEQGA